MTIRPSISRHSLVRALPAPYGSDFVRGNQRENVGRIPVPFGLPTGVRATRSLNCAAPRAAASMA
jgi:hypothetical protein